MTLTALRVLVRYFVEWFSVVICPRFSLLTWVTGCEEEVQRWVLFISPHLKGTWDQQWLAAADVDIDYLVKVVFVRFLNCKVNLFFLPNCSLWKEVIMHRTYVKHGELVLPPWGANIYINYLEFLCIRYLFSSIYLFIQSFVYMSMASWIFIFYFAL